jgi:phosphonate transport system substrate-binding protein
LPPKLAVDSNAAPLRIAFISYANPQQVLQDSGSVIRFLEPFVGVPIKGFVTSDYNSSIEAMKGEQADVAFVDPLAFMMAHEQIGARPLLLEVYSSGKPTYHSTIWVRRDSGIKSTADLKGKVIAFADQVDMSGHLLPREIFVREGLLGTNLAETEFFKRVYFAGGDEQAIRAVQSQYVDAAGVSQYANLLLRPEERDDVVALAHSIESPSHLLMARKGLADETCERIQQALLALDVEQPEDKAILDKLYGVQGYVTAKRSDFAEVAKVAARYGFVRKPEAFSAESEQ